MQMNHFMLSDFDQKNAYRLPSKIEKMKIAETSADQSLYQPRYMY